MKTCGGFKLFIPWRKWPQPESSKSTVPHTLIVSLLMMLMRRRFFFSIFSLSVLDLLKDRTYLVHHKSRSILFLRIYIAFPAGKEEFKFTRLFWLFKHFFILSPLTKRISSLYERRVKKSSSTPSWPPRRSERCLFYLELLVASAPKDNPSWRPAFIYLQVGGIDTQDTPSLPLALRKVGGITKRGLAPSPPTSYLKPTPPSLTFSLFSDSLNCVGFEKITTRIFIAH